MSRTWCLLLTAPASLASGQTPDHLVVGQASADGMPNKLFTSATLAGASGHGPSIGPATIVPIRRISLSPLSSYARPQFGGYSFSTSGASNLGFDYAVAPYNLDAGLLDPPGSNFIVSTRRLSYSRPADFAFYTPTGTPQMVEDNQEYAFGTQSNGGHVHPLILMRRPGQVTWTMRFTSDQWVHSEDYVYMFTSVPGRGTVVPIDMSSIFNADVVDSDGSDSPTPFSASGHSWLLNGNYGASAGLPVDGQLAGFQLGGAAGAGLAGAGFNALFDNGTLSCAAALDLVVTGQDDNYLGIELLLGGSGTFATDGTNDRLFVTYTYSDASTFVVEYKRFATLWNPYRAVDDWQQSATPRPWTAVGPSGDRTTGFSRSTGSGVDVAGGPNFVLFRAGSPLDMNKTLTQISVADFVSGSRIAVMAILAIKKAPLKISTVSLPAAVEGVAYSAAMTADGTPPYRNWMATGLPAGLMLDVDTGALHGTPAAGAAGGSPYSVTISVEDSIHLHDPSFALESDSVLFSLTVTVPDVAGDIDGNGVVNGADLIIFRDVLLGHDADPDHRERSDVNEDGTADGADIGPFLFALF